MRKGWKDTIEIKKRVFLELYEAGARTRTIAIKLRMDEHDVRDWCDRIRILGTSRFLMSHTTNKQYSYEVKLAAVKARIEDQLPYADILAKYGASPKVVRSWCTIYRKQGEEGLKPKKKGRPVEAKHKPQNELTYVEELELRIKRLEAENDVLKKVAALKGLRR